MGKKKKHREENRAGGGPGTSGVDGLPSPDQLLLREESVKVTLSLSRRSVAFFKREADQRHLPYQRMIRAVVDAYAEREEAGR